MKGRKLAFWVGVAGVSVLAQFGMELAARKVPVPGLQRLVSFIHSGGSA